MSLSENQKDLVAKFKQEAFAKHKLIIEDDDPILLVYLIIEETIDKNVEQLEMVLEAYREKMVEISQQWKSREQESIVEFDNFLNSKNEEFRQLLNLEVLEQMNSQNHSALDKTKSMLIKTINHVNKKVALLLVLNGLLLLSNVALTAFEIMENT